MTVRKAGCGDFERCPEVFSFREMSGRGGTARYARGFTLIEVLFAVAVLSVGLVAVVGSFGRSLDAMGSAISAVEATAALEETLWRVKADPESYLRQGEGEVEGFGGQMRWNVEARPEPSGVGPGDPLKHVWVSVGWNEDGTWRSVGASTLVWTPAVSAAGGE